MGMTYKQAKDNLPPHIAALHPAASGRRSKEAELVALYAGPAQPSKAPKDGMSKLERAFRDEVLEPAWVRRAIREYRREAVKLRLAGRTWYAPDFSVELHQGEQGTPPMIVMVELKGFMRDDAAVKLKVAADLYREYSWMLVTREKRRWIVRDVTSSGIGVVERQVRWIHGSS